MVSGSSAAVATGRCGVWHLPTGAPAIGSLTGHTGAVISVTVTLDGRQVVTGRRPPPATRVGRASWPGGCAGGRGGRPTPSRPEGRRQSLATRARWTSWRSGWLIGWGGGLRPTGYTATALMHGRTVAAPTEDVTGEPSPGSWRSLRNWVSLRFLSLVSSG